jgi:2-oxoglutarate ferredoxin oxidoreductase subunit alpha
VLAPSTVQEMVDHVKLGFELAEKYRNPAMILADGAIGQMKEKVTFFNQMERVNRHYDWATDGKPKDKVRRFITSLHIEPEKMELINIHLQEKYRQMEKEETLYDSYYLDDAEYLMTGYGLAARIAVKAMEMGRIKGYKIGLIRPITLFPFPTDIYKEMAPKVKGILDVEMNMGQMIEDVKLATEFKTRVEFFGRCGGVIPSPEEILENFENYFIKEK